MATQFAGINKRGNTPVVSGWVNPVWVFIQATIGGGSGAATIDAVASSPGTTITKSGTGTYDVTYPPGKRFQFISGEVMLADPAGSKLSCSAYSATAGTASFEAAVTPGTAANPADNSRFFVSFIVERG